MSLVGTVRKHPVLGFSLLGAAVFLVDAGLRRARDQVIAPSAVQLQVVQQLEGELGRPPSDDEERAALQDWVADELLFREALAMDLDRNDPVIRAHLSGKLRHIVRERAIQEPPSDEELKAQRESQPERYLLPATYELTHVFVAKAGGSARVAEVLEQLAAGAPPEALGDHFPRGPRFVGLAQNQLEPIFGASLAAVLKPELEHRWQTVLGERGTHLIRVDAISSREPEPEALRASLTADIAEQKKQAAVRSFVDALKRKYPLASSLR